MDFIDGILIGLLLGTINGGIWGFMDGMEWMRKRQEKFERGATWRPSL